MKVNLMQGDCLERMQDIEAGSIDMVLTDPPYGVDYQSNRRTATEKFSKIAKDDGLDWLDDFSYEMHRVMKNNTAAYVFCSWHKVDVFKAALERYFKIKNLLVWVKNNHGSGDLKGAYAPKHEFVFFVHKGRSLLRDGRSPDILEYSKVSGGNMKHPTEKPVELLSRLIKDSSDECDSIFDPFMGSGATGVACVNTNRNFVGIELDSEYFSSAESRIRETEVK